MQPEETITELKKAIDPQLVKGETAVTVGNDQIILINKGFVMGPSIFARKYGQGGKVAITSNPYNQRERTIVNGRIDYEGLASGIVLRYRSYYRTTERHPRSKARERAELITKLLPPRSRCYRVSGSTSPGPAPALLLKIPQTIPLEDCHELLRQLAQELTLLSEDITAVEGRLKGL